VPTGERADHERRVRRALHRLLEIAGVALGSLLAYFILPLDGRLGEVLAAGLVLVAAVALVPLAIRRAREVLVADQPMLVAAQSLTSALTLMIVAFSAAYYVLGTKYPSQVPGVHTKIDGLYFSVTILSTVGFGDITATGQGARVLVTVNMIVNLVLVGLSVRVVSWALSQREGKEVTAPKA